MQFKCCFHGNYIGKSGEEDRKRCTEGLQNYINIAGAIGQEVVDLDLWVIGAVELRWPLSYIFIVA